MQVLPTAPSPTVTHFMNLEALISIFYPRERSSRSQPKDVTFSSFYFPGSPRTHILLINPNLLTERESVALWPVREETETDREKTESQKVKL